MTTNGSRSYRSLYCPAMGREDDRAMDAAAKRPRVGRPVAASTRNLRLPTGANIGRPATSGLGRRARVETQRTGAPRTRPPGPGDTTHPLV